jgi:cytochrome o ubiquinol oxidase subunit 2
MIPLFAIMAMLGGCNFVVMAPSGDVAGQQRDLVVISTILMLLIIIPVIALTVLFAWRYRSSNKTAPYDPEWNHSTQLELVIWAAPLMIVICLGALTWMGTHLLDPYRQIGRISSGKPLPYKADPIEVDVVALDWKWLFIYPEFGIATVNDLAAPVDRPIRFKITSTSVMNSFYIPALAGQIYAMPGMQTSLHAVINAPGDYRGISANYSGAGFSGMHFVFHGMSQSNFDGWVAKAKAAGGMLDGDAYLKLEHPSENEPARTYAGILPDLYTKILNMCVDPGKMCMNEMSMIDAKGGLGLAGITNVLPLEYDKYTRRGAIFGAAPRYVASICTVSDPTGAGVRSSGSGAVPVGDLQDRPANLSPLMGAGLPRLSSMPSLQSVVSKTVGPRRPFNS